MKTNIIIVSLIMITGLLTGCFTAKIASDNKLTVPEKTEIVFESKTIDNLSKVINESIKIKSDKKVRENGEIVRKIEFVKAGFDIVGLCVLFGAVSAIAGIATAIFAKKFGIAASLIGFGFIIIEGSLFLARFWLPIAFIAIAVLLAGGAYELWMHRKQVGKLIEEVKQDIAK